jgi:hypothetical protein
MPLTQTTLCLFDDETPESDPTGGKSEIVPDYVRDYEAAVQDAKHPLEPSPNGGIKLHDLARGGYWYLVDPSTLTEKILKAVDGQGLTVAHLVARAGFMDRLPPALITTPLLMARGGPSDHTVLHEMAWQGCLGSVDLTEEMLLAADRNGFTAAHALAQSRDGDLGKLPRALITPRLLTARDRSGTTVLHCLAQNANLGQVAPRLSTEMLTAVDGEGRTVIQSAVDHGEAMWRIAHLLSGDMLMLKSPSRRTILWYVAHDCFLHRIQPGAFRPGWMKRQFLAPRKNGSVYEYRMLIEILVEDYAEHLNAHIEKFDEKVRAAIFARLFAG